MLLAFLLILYTFSCLVLIFVILVQSGKGGGLSSLGGAGQGISDALGATGAEKALNKLTTWCAIGFMVLAVLISLVVSSKARQDNQLITGPGNEPISRSAGSPQESLSPGIASELERSEILDSSEPIPESAE